MNSPETQDKISEIVNLIQAKLQEIEQARKRSAMFEEGKHLYLDLKNLNALLADAINKINYTPH
jgi:hypothetical protein